MGNKIARTTQTSTMDYYLQDLPSSYNLVLKDVLGKGRLLKSILCQHDEGLVVVKVYFKRGHSLHLKDFERKLEDIRERLKNIHNCHVWPFQCWFETDKAAYLLRQYFFSNLHDRLSTKPFLSTIEKKWLAFQLLHALKQSHDNGVFHGDIKSENVLVTSWNWIYLVDYASFKPTYIPNDDPSDFSFFFDTGERRRCYLAPERFYDPGMEAKLTENATVKASMDIFSVGCVIAEIFLEGEPLFELSQLLAYRRGQYDPKPQLEKIQDLGIRNMILHMIQIDPEARLSCDCYLQSYALDAFPRYFSPLFHDFASCLMVSDIDTWVVVIHNAFRALLNHMTHSDEMTVIKRSEVTVPTTGKIPMSKIPSGSNYSFSSCLSSRVDSAIHLASELISIICDLHGELDQQKHSQSKMHYHEPFLESGCNLKNCACHSENIQPASLDEISGGKTESGIEKECKKSIQQFSDNTEVSGSKGMVLIVTLLCACIRSVRLTWLRRRAIVLLVWSSRFIDDDERLQHVLPYIVAMISDPSALVRFAAVQALCDVLALVIQFPASDAKIFPEYIFPMLSKLPDDPEESVRICYAANLHKIAFTAMRFLECSNALTKMSMSEGSDPSFNNIDHSYVQIQASMAKVPDSLLNGNYRRELAGLRWTIAHAIQKLAFGHNHTPNVRRALLYSTKELCIFFGEEQSNNFLLPWLLSLLNDQHEHLVSVVFEQIIHVCSFVGQLSVEKFIFPYIIEKSLSSDMEEVIVHALHCLGFLAHNKLLRKKLLLNAIQRTARLLCHPRRRVRRSAISFITVISEGLHQVDSHAYLLQILQPFLQREPVFLPAKSDLDICIKQPMPRKAFDETLESSKNDQTCIVSREAVSDNKSKPTNPNAMQFGAFPKHANVATEGESVSVLRTNSEMTKPLSNRVLSANVGRSVERNDSVEIIEMENHVSSLSSIIETQEETDPHSGEVTSNPFSIAENGPVANIPFEGIPVYTYVTSHSEPARNVLRRASPMNRRGNQERGYRGGSKALLQRQTVCIGHVSPLSGSTQKSSGISQNKFVPSPLLSSNLSTTKQPPRRANKPVLYDKSSISPLLVPDGGWRPRGILISHLQEHQLAVNDIAVSYNNRYFVTASDDGTVKIWNSRRLENDISFRSRLTYTLDNGRALNTEVFANGSSVAVGSNTGTIHVFSVNYSSRRVKSKGRFLGISSIATKETQEGAVLSLQKFDADDRPLLLYSTQLNGIHLWDLREERDCWMLKVNPKDGYVTDVVLGHDQNWLVSGSSRGVLTLWDLRFLIPVNTWQYSFGCPVKKMCLLVPSSSPTPSSNDGPSVYVAAGFNEMLLYDVKEGSFKQVFRSVSTGASVDIKENPLGYLTPSSQNGRSNYRDLLDDATPHIPGIRALLPLRGGHVLTGGTDTKIRFWDYARPARSYCVCGPYAGSMAKELYSVKSIEGVRMVQEAYKQESSRRLSKAHVTHAATVSSVAHRDCILAMASLRVNNEDFLVSSSRDGAVKIWK